MQKYGGKQIFSLERLPKMGQKQKTGKKKKERKSESKMITMSQVRPNTLANIKHCNFKQVFVAKSFNG